MAENEVKTEAEPGVETDLLGDPVVEARAPLTLEDRIAELEDRIAEMEAKLAEVNEREAELEAKLERIAASQPRAAYPKTIDELPSPFAPVG